MKIKKKPIEVDAWFIDTAELQFHGDVLDWVHDEYQANNGRLAVVSDGQKMVLRIRTLEGTMTAHDGDVLVKGVDGELYSIKREIFEKTYDVVPRNKPDWGSMTDFEYDTGFPIPPAHTVKPPPNIEVVEIEDTVDGGVRVELDMDYETMKIFAKKGIYQALVDAANDVLDEHGDD
jgi:exosome complex RNA-binding protein Rrp42 (RNase PH superfamily)